MNYKDIMDNDKTTRPQHFKYLLHKNKDIIGPFLDSNLNKKDHNNYISDKLKTVDPRKTNILFAGCSITVGCGVNDIKKSWSYKLYNKMNKDNECSGYFNIGCSGFSSIEIMINVLKYIAKYGCPDFIFILFPNWGRDWHKFNTSHKSMDDIKNGEILDIYTKVHLFNDEKEIFTPGDSPPKVIQTSIGKIASMICYDLEFPELVRLVAENGVELLCVPTNWPEGSFNRSINEPRPMELIKAMSAAATNRIWIALSDRCGEERNISWLEASSVIDPDGWPIAQVGTGAGIVVADIDLEVSKDKSFSPKNHALNDRRPEIYK